MGCGSSKTGQMPTNSTVNPAHPVHQNSLNAGELVTAAALKIKRRANVMAETQEVTEPYVPKNIPKDERTRALLAGALRENVLFASLGTQEVQEMINAMAPVEFPAGAEVIKQGQPFTADPLCKRCKLAARFAHVCPHILRTSPYVCVFGVAGQAPSAITFTLSRLAASTFW
jgi:hypothetical protein